MCCTHDTDADAPAAKELDSRHAHSEADCEERTLKIEIGATQVEEFSPQNRRDVLKRVLIDRIGDRFRIDHCLGEGAFGVVYGAIDRELDHSCIIPVYDVGRISARTVYIVSKWIQGESLAELNKRRRLRPLEAARIVERVAKALVHAHSQGLVHRDVKPANILLDRDGIAYLADFGLAINPASVNASDAITGTPAYMSPEQVKAGSRTLDGRSDVFSLGIVFYELLTGNRPFQGTPSEVIKQVVSRDIEPAGKRVPGLHPLADQVCQKALQRNVDHRFASAGQLLDEVTRLIDRLERGVVRQKEVKTGFKLGSIGCAIQVGVSMVAMIAIYQYASSDLMDSMQSSVTELLDDGTGSRVPNPPPVQLPVQELLNTEDKPKGWSLSDWQWNGWAYVGLAISSLCIMVWLFVRWRFRRHRK